MPKARDSSTLIADCPVSGVTNYWHESLHPATFRRSGDEIHPWLPIGDLRPFLDSRNVLLLGRLRSKYANTGFTKLSGSLALLGHRLISAQTGHYHSCSI